MRDGAWRSTAEPCGPAYPKLLEICVAVCTYNGEAYLGEQLKSIAAQTRRPDRMVIVDDASSDSTPEIARRFAREANFPVVVEVNNRNLGYSRNFERAIPLSTGDVIVLSDQDDVWSPEKLAKIEMAFLGAPEVGLVFSDAELVDFQLKPFGVRLWDVFGFSTVEQAMIAEGRAFELFLRRSLVTGATMAFRSRFKGLVLPVARDIAHDAWISLLVAAVAEVKIIPEPLIMYRQHATNQIGARKTSLLERLRTARKVRAEGLSQRRSQHVATLERLHARGELHPGRAQLLRDAIAHLSIRTNLSDRRLLRLRPILSELVRGRYHQSSDGVYSAARDLLA